MQRLLLVLVPLLLLGGCIGKEASNPSAPVTKEEATITAASSDTPAAHGSPSANANASSGASTSNASSNASTAPVAPPPPPPQPKPWNLTAAAKLGYVAAAGTGGTPQPSPAVNSDAGHCPNAKFNVPVGAKKLALAIAEGGPAGQSPGTYDISIIAPDGTVTHLQPVKDKVPNGAAGASNGKFSAEDPAAGDWSLHAEPLGPSAQTEWSVAITAAGLSLTPPTTIAVAAGC